MYRVFCESYRNYIKEYKEDSSRSEYRYRISMPIGLITDVERYLIEKESETETYRQISDLLYYMESNIEKYPMFKAFLWTLESRGICGKYYGISCDADLNEQIKLVKMFLSLMYWDEAV